MTLKAVILNDTRGDNHFGCFRVMRRIEENLGQRGIMVTARSLVRNDWERDRGFLAAMAASDLILVNGEGTLHHGSRQGDRLLRVASHPARGKIPVALVNTIYQDNPPEWRRHLDAIDLICTRDSLSAGAIAGETGRAIGFVPDLSLSGGLVQPPPASTREMLLIGDSVYRETAKALMDIVRERPDARLLPILKTIKASKPHFPAPLWALREAYIRLHAKAFGLMSGRVIFNSTEQGFIETLRHGRLHVTGRFHSVCFCLFTLTPFLAIGSNSWKIAALMEDMGLGKSRLIGMEDVRGRLASGAAALDFTAEERAAIQSGVAKAVAGTADLFDRIAALAQAGRG